MKSILKNAAYSLPFFLTISGSAQAQTLPYQDAKAPIETRVTDLMGRLTLDEKIVLLNGNYMSIRAVPRLGVPVMRMADAGQGVRGGEQGTLGPATAFPAAVAMAASWNPSLVSRVGEAIGVEAKNKGIGTQMLLGPAVNIQRSPLGGRNGEYFSEDPFLSARLGVSYIRGMQATGTLACVKHFAANNEEMDRDWIDAQVPERALREIYFPSFEAAVKEGDVAAVMSAYNRVNGPHASANRYLLTDVLKRSWGFKGMVMSDWWGVHETAGPIRAGNDIEMPGPERAKMTPANVQGALDRGQVTVADIDANVRRLIFTMLRSGVLDNPAAPNPALVNSAAHRDVALQAALEGTVLLKNEGNILPLDATKLKSIALIGPAASGMQIGATGSPTVTPVHLVKPFEAIKARVGDGVTVTSNTADLKPAPFAAGILTVPQSGEPGFKAEYFANKTLQGAPTLTRTEAQLDLGGPPEGIGPDNWSARFTATLTPRTSGLSVIYFRADDGCRLYLDGKPIIESWYESPATTYSASVVLKAGQKYELKAEYFQGTGGQEARLSWAEPVENMYADAVELARQSDVVILMATTRGTEDEGHDRNSMDLPYNQDELIRQVTAANKKTIVVLNNGCPVTMPWLA
ncbi:beta-glucosidase, partial [bacterium]